jgi:hypothetical protein
VLGAARHQAAGGLQLIREFVYLYGAVSPKDGTCVYLIMPAPNTESFQIFLETLAKRYNAAS